MAWAPQAVSSAGWNRAMKVPDQSSRLASRMAHAPSSAVMWWSWPQACMTFDATPSREMPSATDA